MEVSYGAPIIDESTRPETEPNFTNRSTRSTWRRTPGWVGLRTRAARHELRRKDVNAMPDELQTAATQTEQPSAAPKRDFRQEVTNQIIEMMENGTAPWQKPWEPGALQLPFNPTTERTYRGGNALHLMAVAARKSFDDPRWLTYRQAQQNGWQVRKGEKGFQIEFWQFDNAQRSAPTPDGADSGQQSSVRENAGPIRRVYTVFNGNQIDGIPEYAP